MKRYFLDPQGIPTGRMAGKPGASHIEIAKLVLLASGKFSPAAGDLYDQMFKLGYARVAEDDGNVWVESPRPLTKAQKVFLKNRHHDANKVVHVNDQRFIETKAKPKSR
jgi:hypothetical protein